MKTSSLLVFLLNATVIAADWWSTVNWWKMQHDQADHDKLSGVVSEVAMLTGNVTEFQAKITTQDAEIAALKAANATANAKITTLKADNAQLKAEMQLVLKTIGPMISPPSSPPSPSPPPITTWTFANMVESDDAFTKNGGSPNTYDATAITEQAITTMSITVPARGDSHYVRFGLTRSTSDGTDFPNGVLVRCWPTGLLYTKCEGSSGESITGGCVEGDTLSTSVSGTTIIVQDNGVTVRTCTVAAGTFYGKVCARITVWSTLWLRVASFGCCCCVCCSQHRLHRRVAPGDTSSPPALPFLYQSSSRPAPPCPAPPRPTPPGLTPPPTPPHQLFLYASSTSVGEPSTTPACTRRTRCHTSIRILINLPLAALSAPGASGHNAITQRAQKAYNAITRRSPAGLYDAITGLMVIKKSKVPQPKVGSTTLAQQPAYFRLRHF